MAVYLFFDESGNLDFSKKGTKFFAFGCLTTRNPASLLHPLAALRYQLLEQGVDLECGLPDGTRISLAQAPLHLSEYSFARNCDRCLAQVINPTPASGPTRLQCALGFR